MMNMYYFNKINYMNNKLYKSLIPFILSVLFIISSIQAEYSISYTNKIFVNGICTADIVVGISGNGGPFDIYGISQSGIPIPIATGVAEGNNIIEAIRIDEYAEIGILDRLQQCLWSEAVEFSCDCIEDQEFVFETDFPCHQLGRITLTEEPDMWISTYYWTSPTNPTEIVGQQWHKSLVDIPPGTYICQIAVRDILENELTQNNQNCYLTYEFNMPECECQFQWIEPEPSHAVSLTPPTDCMSDDGSISIRTVFLNHLFNNTTSNGELVLDWSNGVSQSNLNTSWSYGIDNLEAGSYSLTITDVETNCSIEKTFELTPDPIRIVSEVVDECQGQNNGTIYISTNLVNASYEWNDGITDQYRENLSSGQYTITVTSISSGCSSSERFFVGSLDVPITNSTLEIVYNPCPGSNLGQPQRTGEGILSFEGGIPPFRVNDTSIGNDRIVELSLVDGVNNFTITDRCGYTYNHTESVIPTNVAVEKTLAINETSCNGEPGFGTFEFSGEEDPFIITKNGTVIDDNILEPGEIIVALTPGENIFVIEDRCGNTETAIYNDPGCEVSATARVSASAPNQSNGSIDITPITLEGSCSGTLSYAWSRNYSNLGITTEDLTGIGRGYYCVTITADYDDDILGICETEICNYIYEVDPNTGVDEEYPEYDPCAFHSARLTDSGTTKTHISSCRDGEEYEYHSFTINQFAFISSGLPNSTPINFLFKNATPMQVLDENGLEVIDECTGEPKICFTCNNDNTPDIVTVPLRTTGEAIINLDDPQYIELKSKLTGKFCIEAYVPLCQTEVPHSWGGFPLILDIPANSTLLPYSECAEQFVDNKGCGTVAFSNTPGEIHQFQIESPIVSGDTIPSVVLGPLSYNDIEVATTVLHNRTEDSVSFYISEGTSSDNLHEEEKLALFAMDPGNYNFEGLKTESGDIDGVTHIYKWVYFKEAFKSIPTVVATQVTSNESTPTKVSIHSVTKTRFRVKLLEEEIADGIHLEETISYMAFEKGIGNFNGKKIVSGATQRTINNNWSYINFSELGNSGETMTFANPPQLLALQQTTYGREPAFIRYRNLTAEGVEIMLQEKQSKDTEMNHTNQVVGIVAIESNEDCHCNLETSIAGPSTICPGEYVNINVNIPNQVPSREYSYQWSAEGLGGGQFQNFVATSAGVYCVTVTDVESNVCTDVACHELVSINSCPEENCQINPSINGDNLICTGDTISLTATGSTNSSTTYSWIGPGIIGLDDQIQVEINDYGTYCVTLSETQSDGGNCTSQVCFNVNPDNCICNETDIPELVVSLIDCDANRYTITALSSGTPPLNYLWSNQSTDQSLTNVSPGTYTVTITDANNCSAVETQTIGLCETSSVIDFVVRERTNCFYTIEAIQTSGAANIVSSVWDLNNGDSFVLGSDQKSVEVQLNSGTYTLIINYIDENGCCGKLEDTFVVNCTPPPTIQECSYSLCLDCTTGGVPYLSYVGIDGNNALNGTYCIDQSYNCYNGVNEIGLVIDDINSYLTANGDGGYAALRTVNYTICRSQLLEIYNSNLSFSYLKGSNPSGFSCQFDECSLDQGRSQYFQYYDSNLPQENAGLDSFGFALYPNPARDVVSLTRSGKKSSYDLMVIDLNGRKIVNQKSIDSGIYEIDLKDTPPGLYLIHIIIEGEHIVKKLIVDK